MSISTWLITGASSGLGYALAEHVLKQGDQVVLAVVGVDEPANHSAASRPRSRSRVKSKPST
jgi:NAD(P)-dependent dehydrogenase (short-subunit alcohol dehydrogenase family)